MGSVMKPLIVIGDTQYECDKAYMRGVEDCQNGHGVNCNPYKDGSTKAHQWESGHVNESCTANHTVSYVDEDEIKIHIKYQRRHSVHVQHHFAVPMKEVGEHIAGLLMNGHEIVGCEIEK